MNNSTHKKKNECIKTIYLRDLIFYDGRVCNTEVIA